MTHEQKCELVTQLSGLLMAYKEYSGSADIWPGTTTEINKTIQYLCQKIRDE